MEELTVHDLVKTRLIIQKLEERECVIIETDDLINEIISVSLNEIE